MKKNEKGKKNDGAADGAVFADDDAERLRCKPGRFFCQEQYRCVDCHHGDGVCGCFFGHLRRGVSGSAKGAAPGGAGGTPSRFFRCTQGVYPGGGSGKRRCADSQTAADGCTPPPASCLTASAAHGGASAAVCSTSASADNGITQTPAADSAAESPYLYRGMDLCQRPQPQQRPLLHVVRCPQTQNRSFCCCQYGAASSASAAVHPAVRSTPGAAVCPAAGAAAPGRAAVRPAA